MHENVARLYLAQRGRCFHCSSPMLMGSAQKKKSGKFNDGWTREHVVPRSKGGVKSYVNVVLAHAWCNMQRGNTDPTPWMLEKHKSIWERASAFSRKEAKQLLSNKAARGTYCAVYDFNLVGSGA